MSLRVRDRARIQIGIDRHLLTGHGVQCKSGRNLCHTLGTFVDDHKLYDDQNDKHDTADNNIIATYILSESTHHITGITGCEDQLGGRNVQGDPE